MSMSLPHAIYGHSTLSNEVDRSEQKLSHNPNQNIIEKQQALTTSSTFVSLSEKSKNLSRDDQFSQQSTEKEESIYQHSKEEKHEIEQLKKRDKEVRTHEQAHAAVGGQHTGAPSYTYETGPDGKRYVTDGEVPIDLTEIPNDPLATIDKMNQVHRAALAPAEPSNQDRRVAAEAQQTITTARRELATEAQETESSIVKASYLRSYADNSINNTSLNSKEKQESKINEQV